MKKVRDSSIELLRIISMLFIVTSHFCVHGFDSSSMIFSLNKNILQIGTLGNLGVVIFVMISGYFLSQTTFKPSRILKVIMAVAFYSISCYYILVLFNVIPFTVKEMIKSTFPVLFNQYWFATAYVVLYIFTPFLNKLLQSFSVKQYIAFIATLIIVWSIIPTFTQQSLYGNAIGQFVLFYSMGAFARKYSKISFINKYRFLLAIVSSVLLILSTIILNLLSIKFPMFNKGAFFYSRYSILIIALAYSLLLIFIGVKNIKSKFVNNIASTTFAIYLIHDNNYLRSIIWKDILHVQDYKDSPYLLFYLLLFVIVVFMVCSCIDLIRQKIIEKPILGYISPKIDALYNKASDFLRNKLDYIFKDNNC